MLAITLGPLIALGSKPVWNGCTTVASYERRENITQEMRDNQRNLAAQLKTLPAGKTHLKTMLEVTANLQRTGSFKTTTHKRLAH
ncbi:MAG TPA: hypothetical protein VF772_17045 [Terriglobales bacterium]